MGRPTSQGGEDTTRELILQNATELFGARGFDGVHMRDIAARVDLTMPAIYYHFKSKEQLYEAVVANGVRKFQSMLAEVAHSAGSVRQRLTAIVDFHFKTAREVPALFRLFYQVLISSENDRRKEIYAEAVLETDRLIRQVLEEGIAAGEIRPGVVVDAATLITGAISAVNLGFLAFGANLQRDYNPARLVDLLVDGLTTR